MKTFNTKLIFPLLITLILTGCMPDSLTKFKKDPPKKAAPIVTDSDGGAASGPIIDDSGQEIPLSELVDPTIFKYSNSNGEYITAINAEVGRNVTLTPVIDGSVGSNSLARYVITDCKVSRPLPSGLTISKSKTREACTISGTPLAISSDPLNPGAPIRYTITLSYNSSTGFVKTISTTMDIGVYVAPVAFSYAQNEKIMLRLNINSGSISTMVTNSDVTKTYVREGFITSDLGVTGVVKFIDPETYLVGVIRTIPIKVNNINQLALPATEFPGLSTPRYISAAGGKSAKVIRTNFDTSTIYVEMISSNYFLAGDSLDNDKDFLAGTGATIESVDLEYGFKQDGNNPITVDNNIQHFASQYNVVVYSRAYEVNIEFGDSVGQLPRLLPTSTTSGIMEPINGVTYSVAPELPSGLALNKNTGEITGKFEDILNPTQFNITAKNPIGSTTYRLGIGAIKPPKDLSYSVNQLITVNTSSKFLEAEQLYQPVAPPLAYSVSAKLLRKYDSGALYGDNRYRLAIENANGVFGAGASLDSGNFFYSEKAFIPATAVAPPLATTATTTPVVAQYDVALKVSTIAPFAVGGYVSTPQGALGRVMAIEPVSLTLFIQSLTPLDSVTGLPVYKSFQERNGGVANSLDNAEVYAGAEASITQVEASVMTLTLGTNVGTPDFTTGNEVSSSAGLGAYIFGSNQTDRAIPVATTTIDVSDITRTPGSTPYFARGQTIYDDEVITGGNSATIDNVETKNAFILERGVISVIRAGISQGNNLTYTISPALPAGLSLDTRSGLISGRPTVRTAMKSYVVTATNLIGKSYRAFDLEIRDYFKITDESGATTFKMHKYGKFRNNRECKINATDIIEGTGDLDVRCFLDGEEEEFHSKRLRLASSSGAGVCEFIEVEPYSFYQYPPTQTPNTKTQYTFSGCAQAADVTAAFPGAEFYSGTSTSGCDGDYSDSDGPNCDGGSFQVVNYFGELDAMDNCTIFTAQPATVVKCNGKASSCLQGPVKDLLTDSEIAQGYRSIIYPNDSGGLISSLYSTPYSKLDATNLRVVNGTIANGCNLTNDDADAWEEYAKDVAPTTSPFGQASPFYTMSCVDGANDIKARVRVMAREWNKTFKINSNIDVDLPGVAVNAGDLMNNSAIVFGKNTNDYSDWDDMTTYGAHTCSATVVASTCSNPLYTTYRSCVAAGGTWTPSTWDVPAYTYPRTNL